MDVGEHCLYVARHGEGVVVGVARHTYHEVDVHGMEHLISLLGGAHLRERGRIAQSQFHILVVNLLLYTSVVLEHEGIVRVRHYQNVVYAAQHEVHERHILQIETAELLRYGVLFHSMVVYVVIL